MPKKKFAYLHSHTKYSLQDAMPSVKDYVNAIYKKNLNSKDYECVGLAITDHGNISALVDHYNDCLHPDDENRKVHPIFGIEVYHSLNSQNDDRFHLVLLAKNQVGLENLYMIASHAGMNAVKGRTGKMFPITNLDYMRNHGEGIICLTACVAGLVPHLVLNGLPDDAIKYVEEFKNIFDEVYLEVQPFDFPEQLLVNNFMVDLAKKKKMKLVMTCDSHYIDKTDKAYHDILKNISHQKPFTTCNDLKSPEEMEQYCKQYGIPLDAITNTALVAEACQVDPKPKDHSALLPKFPCPNGYDESSYLRKLVFDKFQNKIVSKHIVDVKKYTKQLLYELDVICNAGFAGYFLILWDWFKWCRENDILMGPGRGSAAGSIVSYLLDITKEDPVKADLYFERFLSPQRLEFPDIDSDVPRDKRAEAIRYLLSKYGQDNVSQIVTFGEYKIKNTIKAVLSDYGCPIQEANAITKAIPDFIDGKTVSFEWLEDFSSNPDKYSDLDENSSFILSKTWDSLTDVFKKYPKVYDALKHICGCYNNMGIHAGGVIICSKPINQNGQIMLGGDTAVLPVLQFKMSDLDFFGFLKIDVLGLKTLDVIKLTMDLVNLDYDWYDSEDFSDQAVYDMLKRGETCDVFQMSRYTPTKMIKDFNVTDIDGLCAVNAGNRPGPLEKDKDTGKSMVDLYAENVKTQKPEDWGNKDVNQILAKTYGCLWYQEQCISLGKTMAGYSMGDADFRIRKTLGKKKVKMIPEIRNEFIYGKKSLFDDKHNVVGISNEPSPYCSGAIARGYSEELADKVFTTMEAFAKYSFNKSHSFCYAGLAYKTAWLSCYYPVEFAIANCTINEKEEDVISTLANARKRKIRILPPDINKSQTNFSNDNGAIRYGLKAIKGVGSAVINFLNEYKQLNNIPFKDFDDFYTRIHDGTDKIVSMLLNSLRSKTGKATPNPLKKDVEIALILSGCFDYCEPNRYKLLNHYLSSKKGLTKGAEVKIMDKKLKVPLKEKDYNDKVKLELEKFYMGAYISEHPLDKFPYVDLDSASENEQVKVGGIITKVEKKKTKTNKDYITILFKTKDDIERRANVFDSDKAKSLIQDLKKNQIVVISGRFSAMYKNINAFDVKIQIEKKQILKQENLDIQEPEPVVQVVQAAPIVSDIFSDFK